MHHKWTEDTIFVNGQIPSERIDDETEREIDELFEKNYVIRNRFSIRRSERKPFIKDIQILQDDLWCILLTFITALTWTIF
jgi:hypothetical protein